MRAPTRRVVCDVAGNCATAGPIAGHKIDRKAPVITLATPADGATYPLNEACPRDYACADAGAGTTACAGTVANGTPIDTSSTGTKTFVVTAVDAVGNSSRATVTYTRQADAHDRRPDEGVGRVEEQR